MLILIPPSEGKSSKNTTETKFDDTNFIFSKQVKEIVEILKDKKEEIEKIYGTSLEKSKDLQEKNLSVFSNTCSKAIERYTGVVYNQLDLNNYSEESKNYFNSKIRIFSGLFGMVKPNTLIPDYKLKMNVLGLTKFWSPFLSYELSILLDPCALILLDPNIFHTYFPLHIRPCRFFVCVKPFIGIITMFIIFKIRSTFSIVY